MNKKIFNRLTLALTILAGQYVFIGCNQAGEHQIKEKGVHSISVKKGSSFTFSMPQNKSTGYELCWINEPMLAQRFQLQQIKSKLNDPNNVDGGGEEVIYQMIALEAGTDTLKFQLCPTRLWQKDCAFFAGDSARVEQGANIVTEYSPYRPADFNLVVKVEAE